MIRALLLTTIFTTVSAMPAAAQSIEVGQLDSAALYDVGVIDSATGGLDQNLWQGTDAARAAYLLENISIEDANPLVQDMVRAVVLSGGVPPHSDNAEQVETYARARLQTILDLGEMGAAQTIIGRTPALADDLELRAHMALMSGDNTGACAIADTVIEGRGEPVWARLRAFCHVLRGEIPAAELTIDILRASDYDDPAYFSLMSLISGGAGTPDLDKLRADDALHVALMAQGALDWPRDTQSKILAARRALNEMSSPEDRLNALYAAGPALSDQQMGRVLDALAASEPNLAGGAAVTLDQALNATFPLGTGQLWTLAQSGSGADRAKAAAELLRRVDGAGAFRRFSVLLAPSLQSVPADMKAGETLNLFTRAAILRGDISALQGIHRALDEEPLKQARIALITDALGYGFLAGPLGVDIESRLTLKGAEKARAERDVFIALAMGATLSGVGVEVIESLSAGQGQSVPAGQGLGLGTASERGAKAETVLWAAHILSGGSLDNEALYRVIAALNETGLTKVAGRIAAEDFLVGLE